jgi:hypothetical protein
MPKLYVYQRAEDLGLPVQDGKERVLVTVTATDVVKAKKADSKHCALSRATMRLPGVNAAYFFRSTALIEYPDRIVRFALPPSVQKEIVSFDRAQIFAPGVYQLTPVSPNRDPKITASYRKQRKVKAKRIERAQRRAAASAKSDLTAKIERIASRAPVNDTPEQRAFDLKIAGIMGARAPMPLKPETKFLHRSQYVRGMNEPK